MLEVNILDKDTRELHQGDIILFNSDIPYMVISRRSANGLEYNLINLTRGKLGNTVWYPDINKITNDYYDVSKVYRGEEEITITLG